MKKGKSIIALLVVLVILLGSYVFIKRTPKKNNENKDISENVQVVNLNRNEITKVILTNDKGTITLDNNEKEWTVPNADFKLNQNEVNSLVNCFTPMHAERVVEEAAKDLDKYGLKKPIATADIMLKDGTKKELYLGSKTHIGNSSYVMIGGDEKIYSVDERYTSFFLADISGLRDRSLLAVNLNELTYAKLAEKQKPVIEIKVNNFQSDIEKSYNANHWLLSQPYSEPKEVNRDKMNDLINGFSQLSIEEFVEEHPKSLETYGLDKPSFEIELKDKTNTNKIYFGKDKDENTTYFKTHKSEAVYTMAKSKITPFKIKPFDLTLKTACSINVDDLDQIIIEAKGSKSVIDLSRTTKKAEKSGEKDEVVTTYHLDNEKIEESSFKDFYRSLIGILVDSEIDKKLEEKPEIKTTFILNKGDNKRITVNYVPYNDEFYAVFKNGKVDFVVAKNKVENMVNELEKIKKAKVQ